MTDSAINVTTLDNGMTIIGEPLPERKSLAIAFFVKTGARDETARESGVSHFLEHMMFKGTPTRSSLQLSYDWGSIGAQTNAFTSEEQTVFYAALLPEYFERGFAILSDMLRPSLDPHEYSLEQKVILEEIALYQDRPQFYLFEHAFKDYFGAHPAGNSVLGSNESISALTRDEMKSYFDRRYVPGNMVLVACGAIDWNGLVAQAKGVCGAWSGGQCGRIASPHASPGISRVYRKKNLNQAHLLFLTRGASAQSDDRDSLSVLASILGDSSGSKLYWALVDKGIADTASTDNDERDGTGAFFAYASFEPERLGEVRQCMLQVLAQPAEFSEDELDRAKTRLISRMVLNGELPLGRTIALGSAWNYRRQVESLPESIERIKAVDRSSIAAALGNCPLDSWSEFQLLPE